MKTAAIIPTAGSGSRMASAVSKQYLLLGGIPLIVHTLRAFQETSIIDDIFLILPAQDIEKAQQDIVEKYGLSKVRKILPGGRYRQDSVRSGLDALTPDYDIVVIHDGVRPFITQELIEMTTREAEIGPVTVGVPVKDTVKTIDPCQFVGETLNRGQIWLTQTPQVFRVSLIKEAYRRAYEDNYYGTDDAALVERMGVKVKMMLGSYDNIKITTMIDLSWAELMMTMRDGCTI